MAWLDGLDIPLVTALDAGFFQYGPDEVADRSTPALSRNERLWGHAGLRPVGVDAVPRTSPLMAYRWAGTDAALDAQIELDAGGHPGAVGPGPAAVRYVHPGTGGDALVTRRMEMHRLSAGASTATSRRVGSSVWQVFAGDGRFDVDGETFAVGRGDLVAVPSWCRLSITAGDGLDLFTFSDAPVYDALHLATPEEARDP